MRVEKESSLNRERTAPEVRDLQEQLADAWWNEAPYQEIEKPEKEIAARTRQAPSEPSGA
jgi:hypothetical protein